MTPPPTAPNPALEPLQPAPAHEREWAHSRSRPRFRIRGASRRCRGLAEGSIRPRRVRRAGAESLGLASAPTPMTLAGTHRCGAPWTAPHVPGGPLDQRGPLRHPRQGAGVRQSTSSPGWPSPARPCTTGSSPTTSPASSPRPRAVTSPRRADPPAGGSSPPGVGGRTTRVVCRRPPPRLRHDPGPRTPRRHPMNASRNPFSTLVRVTSSPHSRREPLTFPTPPAPSRPPHPSDTRLQVSLRKPAGRASPASSQVRRQTNLQVCICRMGERAAPSIAARIGRDCSRRLRNCDEPIHRCDSPLPDMSAGGGRIWPRLSGPRISARPSS